jgi:hypothetical protein
MGRQAGFGSHDIDTAGLTVDQGPSARGGGRSVLPFGAPGPCDGDESNGGGHVRRR